LPSNYFDVALGDIVYNLLQPELGASTVTSIIPVRKTGESYQLISTSLFANAPSYGLRTEPIPGDVRGAWRAAASVLGWDPVTERFDTKAEVAKLREARRAAKLTKAAYA
jgi:hypothetical protein